MLLGEQVKAVVQVGADARAQAALADRLAAYCREHLAGFKCPRSFEFTTGELRTPVGKIRRGPLREHFGAAPAGTSRGRGVFMKQGRPYGCMSCRLSPDLSAVAGLDIALDRPRSEEVPS